MIKKSAHLPFSIEPRESSTPRANAELIVLAAKDSFMLNLKSMQAKLMIKGLERHVINSN
jgi:hypothetical protein